MSLILRPLYAEVLYRVLVNSEYFREIPDGTLQK